METDNKQTIDDIVKLLEEIKAKHGNLYVSEIFYGSEDYPKIEVIPIKPCVITDPLHKDKHLVIFDI